jgi:hypothetical protein
VQYHPEFLSRPTKPSPIFYGFIKAAGEYLDKKIVQNRPLKSNHQLQNGISHETNGGYGVGLGKRNEEEGENGMVFTN